MLPRFDANGNPPAGIHGIAGYEFTTTFGRSDRRRVLLSGLVDAMRLLRAAGFKAVAVSRSHARGTHGSDFPGILSDGSQHRSTERHCRNSTGGDSSMLSNTQRCNEQINSGVDGVRLRSGRRVPTRRTRTDYPPAADRRHVVP
jgi:hypothetical protein